jgi:hypothetical protein
MSAGAVLLGYTQISQKWNWIGIQSPGGGAPERTRQRVGRFIAVKRASCTGDPNRSGQTAGVQALAWPQGLGPYFDPSRSQDAISVYLAQVPPRTASPRVPSEIPDLLYLLQVDRKEGGVH